jgi:antitoxin component of MazEF toxin-antitoxin module
MPARIERKILETGTSRAVALPPDWMRALKLDKGDPVDVLYNFIVLVKPKNVKLDPEFLRKELEILANLETGEACREASE